MTSERFQVDLGGLVEILSKNLYSGPQVYLRELLQNGVDAITARQKDDAEATTRILIEPWADGTGLTVTDTGTGMTAESAQELLATIGRSSKRHELFGGKAEFMGQFGIGLLAAFLIADEIDVITRAENHKAVHWQGRADGTFSVREIDDDLEIGSRVSLRARQGAENWVSEETVLSLAKEYSEFLPFDIRVVVAVAGQRLERRVSSGLKPWDASQEPAARHRHLVAYCEQEFGFTPLAVIDVDEPLTGTHGAAFVLPAAVAPGSGKHRVYVKNMLVDRRDQQILPEWAFFVRAVVNSELLSLTASREQLRVDDVLLGLREKLGEQVKAWLLRTLEEKSKTAEKFYKVHSLALRSLAVSDLEVLDVVAKVLPFETSQGLMTLREAANQGVLTYADTLEGYRRIAPVARAQGLTVVNGGYVYDADLIAKLQGRQGISLNLLSASELVGVLGLVSEDRLRQVDKALQLAESILAEYDCEVLLRSFAPESLGAMLLQDPETERAREFQQEQKKADDLWSDLLSTLAPEKAKARRTVVLNDANPTVQRILSLRQEAVFAPGLVALYLEAVMLSGEPLNSSESSGLAHSLDQLVTLASQNKGIS